MAAARRIVGPAGQRHAGRQPRASPGTPFEGPFDGRLVYDLVYDPDPTRADARRGGGRVRTVIGGLEMLVAQAERQFEIWTGQRPPAGLVRERRARPDESAYP